MGSSFGLFMGGMPMPELTQIAKLRLDAISFFLLLLFIGTLAIQWGWNRMSSDFSWMPRMKFRQAFGLTIVWGLLFLLVLTMISGARELMTPGAWERDGLTYQLREATPTNDNVATAERRQRLVDLAALVRRWKKERGRFPSSLDEAGVPEELQFPPGSPFNRYRIVISPPSNSVAAEEQPTTDSSQQFLLIEPNIYPDPPMQITAHGIFVSPVQGDEQDD